MGKNDRLWSIYFRKNIKYFGNIWEIIIEFKAGKDLSADELASLAKDAIKQIHDNEYFADMEYHGVKNIGLFGIGFSGKHVATEFEHLIIR